MTNSQLAMTKEGSSCLPDLPPLPLVADITSDTLLQPQRQKLFSGYHQPIWFTQISSNTLLASGTYQVSGILEQIARAESLYAPRFWPGVNIVSSDTSPPDRRRRNFPRAAAHQLDQHVKNSPAIALLKQWLVEDVDQRKVTSSLEETISDLNTTRSFSRKLYP